MMAACALFGLHVPPIIAAVLPDAVFQPAIVLWLLIVFGAGLGLSFGAPFAFNPADVAAVMDIDIAETDLGSFPVHSLVAPLVLGDALLRAVVVGDALANFAHGLPCMP